MSSTDMAASGQATFLSDDVKTPLVLAALAALVLTASVVSIGTGAITIPAPKVVHILLDLPHAAAAMTGDAAIVLQIRLPRLLTGLMVGAALAVSGAVMQGLFRNPLADPGIIGVSSGASLAAACIIVLGDAVLKPWLGTVPFPALPVGAFLGALAAILVLSAVSIRHGRISVVTMLLAGVALGALTGACLGFLSYISDDRQLRDLSFWTMGSLGGASWSKATAIAPLILPVLFLTPLLARGLNALALGEAEAFHLGLPVQRIKFTAILFVAIAVGASTAVCGLIGFVGIVVPHMLRIAFGADHRLLLPASALAGSTLLVGADTIARTVVAPAELPIGILTALIGAPFFIWLLLYRREGLLS